MRAAEQMDITDRAVAIIGMAGRFPGARDIATFWDNLVAGRESITCFSEDDLVAAGVDPAVLRDSSYVRANGVLDEIEWFDAAFFGLSPLEAEITDPQHRLFLECAWQALEDAGHTVERFEGRIAVFAGAGASTYLLHNLLSRPDVLERVRPVQLSIANNKDYVPTRVSYKLNLKGPSVSVNTACSSSLVAVHLACQSLLDYHSDMVLAGGVGIQVPQNVGYHYHSGGIVSPDGHCRPFAARAQGTVSGNGAGIVVLRRLADALADGDAVRAVILGSAVNNDGAAKVGYTAPSVAGQTEVIAEALAVAEVSPETVQYVEAHGTGTTVGDPIEIAALTQAFQLRTGRTGFCAIGSVKSNIGHLDEAAGAAGLIKTVLALQHRQIPPTLHFEQPNPTIDFPSTPFYVNAATEEWAADGPRRAGVSSFGIGGTNAHVVLQEAPQGNLVRELSVSGGCESNWQLLTVSARTDDALDRACATLAPFLRNQTSTPLANIAWTLQHGRRSFEKRRAVVCADHMSAAVALDDLARAARSTPAAAGTPRIAFLFPGQGAQYAGMGRGLYEAEPVFRQAIDRCAEAGRPLLGPDLRQIMSGHDSPLITTLHAQPALFAIEYALARLWMSWGIQPHAMIGHSLGEYVAATLAGVFSLEDALHVVAMRAQLMNALPRGAMIAVPLGEDDVAAMVDVELSIAAVNGPTRTVVSGPMAAIDRFQERLEARGIEGRRLATSHAFHSAMMDVILERFAECVAGVERRPPSMTWMSNVTGAPVTTTDAIDPAYWAAHVRQPVRFAPAAAQLLADPSMVFLEVGPGRTLVSLLRGQTGYSPMRVVAQSLPHADDTAEDSPFVLEALGRLWVSGADVDWRAVHRQAPRQRVALPTYSFSRQRYWIEPRLPTQSDQIPAASHKRSNLRDWFYLPSWKRTVAPRLDGRAPARHTVVICDPGGVALNLVEELRRTGQHTHAVSISRQDPHSYAAILRDVPAGEQVCIVDCTTLGDDRSGATADTAVHVQHILQITRSLMRHSDEMKLIVVTDGVADVTGLEIINPAKAAIAGPLLVVSQEHLNITSRLIDLTGWTDAPAWRSIADDILAGDNRFVAWRQGRRWTSTFDAASMPESSSAVPLREGGAYLITGGLGGVGLILAEHLARTRRARIALVARSAAAVAAAVERHGARDDAAQSGGEREQVISLALAAAHRERQTRGVEAYSGLETVVGRFCCSNILRLLAQAGIDTCPGAAFDIQGITRALRVVAALRRMCEHFAHVLVDYAVLQRSGDTLRFTQEAAALPKPDALLRELLENYPEFAGTLDLLQHCFDHYPSALSGEIPAISVLYPQGEATLLERASARTVAHTTRDAYVRAVRDLLVTSCERNPTRRLRVLEIGVGDGILAGIVAPALKEFNVEYYATDLGRTFVARAEQAANAAGLSHMMRFGVLDIARDPAAQGFEDRSFDVVLALDVLHATTDLATTVQHVRQLVASGGAALIVEAVAPPIWVDFIWGLADGWWGFRDVERRQRSPLLPMHEWVALCREAGFAHVTSWPAADDDRARGDYGLVMAEEGEQVAHAVRTVRHLTAQGTEVLLLAADVGDEAAMRSAIMTAERRFGRLDGVIHAAGVTAREVLINPIDAIERETLAAVLRPKVDGTRVLAQLLSGKPLDFILLVSSNASVLGGLGLAAYAAASRYLDAFAVARHHEGDRRWVSSNWDGWPTEAAAGLDSAFQTSIDRYAMSLDECRSAFERVLSARVPQVIVSAGDLAARVQRWIEGPAAARATPTVEPELHARPDVKTTFQPPTTETERTLAQVWEELLGLRPVGIEDVFAELGGDSLLGTQLIARVERLFGCRLPFRSLFEEPTVRQQAARIDGRVAETHARSEMIPKLPEREHYPLSHAQRRLWVLSQLDGSSAYNIPLHQVLEGALDIGSLHRALDRLVVRHHTLRTRYVLADGEPFQQIDAPAAASLPVLDLTGEENPQDAARLAAAESAAAPFDLASGAPFRVSLLRLAPECHVLLFTIHHIACDGVSIHVLARDLAELYRAERQGTSPSLPNLGIQYRDYAAWQMRRLESGVVDDARAYWLRQLGAPSIDGARSPAPVLQLPMDFPRPSVQTFRGRERGWHLDPAAAQAVVALARTHSVSLFMVLSACVKVLLYRYTGQQDLVIGTPVAGRTHPDLDGQVGCYLNMLPLRDTVTPEARFGDFLDQIRRTATAAYDHQEYPFDRLVDELAIARDLSRSPLIDVVVMLQNQQESELALEGLQSRPFFQHNGTSKVDLTFNFKESGQGLAIGIEYNTDLFTDERVERLGAHFLRMLDSIMREPAQRLGAIDMLSPDETSLIARTNATARDYPRSATVVELVSARVLADPDRVACECGGSRISYRELQSRAARIGHMLKGRGVARGDRVGVYLDRSIEIAPTLLGILNAGAVYVPLDPAFPADRLRYMAADAGVRTILTRAGLAADCQEQFQTGAGTSEGLQVVSVDAANLHPDAGADSTAQSSAGPTDLAYIIYTSGSTGKPKGVGITHASLVNFLCSMETAPGLRDDDTMLAVTTWSFDISALEIFLPLMVGARLVIATREEATDGVRLQALVRTSGATVMQATPATWQMMFEAGWQGAPTLAVLCGGEALHAALAERLVSGCRRVWNLYGPTETTIWSSAFHVTRFATAHETSAHGSSPIGLPIANTSLHVLDGALQMTPVGVPGELYISGDGLARGYLNLPAVTAERFIPNPFADTPGERMYRTGDVVIRRPDGALQFIARIDEQVKLRGFRVELGEIENALLTHAHVARAAVVLEGNGADACVLAAVVPKSGVSTDASHFVNDLRAHLRAWLPEHMVPAGFVMLADLPLTPNGKIDRSALLTVHAGRRLVRTGGQAPPSTDLERRLCRIWAQVLDVESIGVDANFFEFGGHSLTAARLAFRITNETGVRIGLADIFQHATVAELAVAMFDRRDPDQVDTALPHHEPIPIAPLTADELDMLRE